MFHRKLIKRFQSLYPLLLKIVSMQWINLIANIIFLYTITYALHQAYLSRLTMTTLVIVSIIVILVILVRRLCSRKQALYVFESSTTVKKELRHDLFAKILRLGPNYHEVVNSAEMVQVCSEGVEQLEVYIGRYLPQFVYAMIAPLTLFLIVAPMNLQVAFVLFLGVPLIPISIILVQRFARKLLDKYWGNYTQLGDSFLENLQALTTLKIYSLENEKMEQMRKEAENFRRITMRVLIMQLNSISIMDLVAYGGSALGVLLVVLNYQKGMLTLQEALFIILICVEFFLPMRLLGSYFHIAMNGNASANKIFRILELEEYRPGAHEWQPGDITLENVTFGYTQEREILHEVSMHIPDHSFVAIVGESGSGKSTIASLWMQQYSGYTGSMRMGNVEVSEIDSTSLYDHVCKVTHDGYIFKGSIRENLRLGKAMASEKEMWTVLEQVSLAEYVRSIGGLDSEIAEGGSSLSGGQRQRLALARALLSSASVYIFDEATSNVDSESETAILRVIQRLSKEKTVIFITHRLASVKECDKIYVMHQGEVCEQGDFDSLMKLSGKFAQMYEKQRYYERIVEVDSDEEE